MLTQLSTLKTRLTIDESYVQFDAFLTNTLLALTRRFDSVCTRTLARTVNATLEFYAGDLEITPPIYPIESVSKFETKSSESEGWIEQTGVDYLIRNACIISLQSTLGAQASTLNPSVARITYTGGYVLPGTTPSAGQTALPEDIEQACIEQAASWFQNRDKLGLTRNWPHLTKAPISSFSIWNCSQTLNPSLRLTLAGLFDVLVL
jgi:hypothetical protein